MDNSSKSVFFLVLASYSGKKVMNRLIGRRKEQAKLQACMNSERSEFVVIYGRRRIGKTFLVRRFFEDKYAFSFVGKHEMTKDLQLQEFAKSLQQVLRFGVCSGAQKQDRSF